MSDENEFKLNQNLQVSFTMDSTSNLGDFGWSKEEIDEWRNKAYEALPDDEKLIDDIEVANGAELPYPEGPSPMQKRMTYAMTKSIAQTIDQEIIDEFINFHK